MPYSCHSRRVCLASSHRKVKFRNDIDSLTRRLLGRIWNALPQEQRTIEALRAEVLERAAAAADAFKPGQKTACSSA